MAIKSMPVLAVLRNWCRAHPRELFWFALLFLIATLSFGLGYLANRELSHAPIIIERTGP